MMKKFIISVLTLLLAGCLSSAFAQTEGKTNPVKSGNFSIKLFDVIDYAAFESGDLYTDENADKDAKVIGINTDLLGQYSGYFPRGTEINYFILDGLALGGSFHYAKHTSEMGFEDTKYWSIGPSVYYYYSINEIILPYATISYVYSKYKNDFMELTMKSVPVGIGVTFMVGQYIGIYGQVTCNFDQVKNKALDMTTKGKITNLTAGFKVFF